MRIPCKSCECMMLSINREATRYKCPCCGKIKQVVPMSGQRLVKDTKREKTTPKKIAYLNKEKSIDFDIDKYKRLRANGLSIMDIEVEMNLSKDTLYRHRKMNGLLRDKEVSR